MKIRHVSTTDLTAVHHLLASNGWAHRIDSVEHLAKLISASQRALVAVEEGEVIGFARAITDGLANGYLSMVVVAAPFRRRGVGQELVEKLIGADPDITWVLRAGRDDAEEFFAKLGFSPSTMAMERLRRTAAS